MTEIAWRDLGRKNFWRPCEGREQFKKGRVLLLLLIFSLLSIISLEAEARQTIFIKEVKIGKSTILDLALSMSNICGNPMTRNASLETMRADTAINTEIIGHLPSPRQIFAIAQIDSKAYIIGGTEGVIGTETDEVVEIDTVTGNISVIAHLPKATYGLAAVTANGKIYAIGGADEFGMIDDIVEIDPRTGNVSVIAHLPSGRMYMAVAAVNGKIYVIGGWIYNMPPVTDEVLEIDPETGQVRVITYLPFPMGYESCWSPEAVVVSNRIYAIAGMTFLPTENPEVWEVTETDEIIEIDPITMGMRIFHLPSPRFSLGVAVTNGKIYAVGGWATDQLDEVVEIDPTIGQVKVIAHLPSPRVCVAAIGISRKIYAIGGYHGPLWDVVRVDEVVEVDPVMMQVDVIAHLPSPRAGVSAAAVNEKIYAIDGASEAGLLDEVVEIEIYALPDLDITSTPLEFFNNSPPFLPNVLKIEAHVVNIGGATAEHVVVKFFQDGVQIGSDDIGAIEPGAHKDAVVEWAPTSNVEDATLEARAELIGQEDAHPSDNVISWPLSFYWVDFRHDRDAFQFPNWYLSSPKEYFEELAAVFGSGGIVEKLKTIFGGWFAELTAWGGHCYGMATTSAYWYMHPSGKPIQVRGKDTYQMNREEDGVKAAIIERHWAALVRLVPNLYERLIDYNAREQYNRILNNIKSGLPVVLALWNFKSLKRFHLPEAHAVTGYSVLDLGEEKRIYVYDNEIPLKYKVYDNYATFDLSSNTSKFDTFNRVVAVPTAYYFLPLSVSDIKNLLKERLKELWNKKSIFLWMHSPIKPLITDELGRRIGYVDGVFVNEIPGAEVEEQLDSHLFYLPRELTYMINMTGTEMGLLGLDIVVPISESRSRVAIFKGIPISPGSRASTTLSATDTTYQVVLDTGEIIDPESVGEIGPSDIIPQGDINEDGALDATDVRWLVEAIMGLRELTQEQRERADVAPPPGLDSTDTRYIVEFIQGIRSTLTAAEISAEAQAGSSMQKVQGAEIKLESKQDIVPGETTTLQFSISGLSDPGLADMQIGPQGVIKFDPQVIQVRSVKGIRPFQVMQPVLIDNEKGEVRFIAVAVGKKFVKEGPIIELEVRAVGREGESSPIEITGFDALRDGEIHDIEATIVNGRVTLGKAEKLQVSSVLNIPNPVTGGSVEFRAEGSGIKTVQLEIFDLSGRRVFNSGEVLGNALQWNLLDDSGNIVANGVYLYLVTVRGFNGEVYRSSVKKLVVLR